MESAFRQVESCGNFQVAHVFNIQLIRCAFVWALYLMVFGNYEPAWNCVINSESLNSLKSSHLNGSTDLSRSLLEDLSAGSGSTDLSRSFLKDLSAGSSSAGNGNNGSRYSSTECGDSTSAVDCLLRSIIAAYNSNETSGNRSDVFHRGTCDILPLCDDVVFDPTSKTLVTEFGLICDQAFIPSIIFAVQMLGMLVGANAGGQLGDIFGRKLTIYGSMALTSAATMTAVWSTSWQMYTVLTFFIGFGGGGIVASLNVYAMEFLTPKWRGRFGAIPQWNISLLIFAFVIIGLKVWWQIHIFCSVGTALFLLCAFWTPESVRWLHVHGKEEKVKEVVKKIMKCNRREHDASDVISKLNQDDQKVNVIQRRYTYLDLFRTSKMRGLTIKVSIVWFLINMCYFTLGFSVKSLSGDYYVNLLVSCASEIPFILLLGPCVNKLGRRFTACLFMSLTSAFIVACIVTHYVMSSSDSGTVIKYLAFVAKGCAIVGWSTMTIFSTELFPTVVRTLALGFFNTSARLGGIVASTLIPRDPSSTIFCFFILSGSVLIASIIVMTLPETKDKPLVDRIMKEEKELVIVVPPPNQTNQNPQDSNA